jgi:tetratricopeptide repeat protein 21B
MNGYLSIARRSKVDIENAVGLFTDVLKEDPDNVGALVGISTALHMLKQDPKARNHLKRVTRMVFIPEEWETFEKAHLLLADIYIEGGKFDLAQQLLKRTIQLNQSC